MSLRWAVFSWQPHNKHKDLHVNSSGFPGTSSKEVFIKVINRILNTLTFSLTEHKRGGGSRETHRGERGAIDRKRHREKRNGKGKGILT